MNTFGFFIIIMYFLANPTHKNHNYRFFYHGTDYKHLHKFAQTKMRLHKFKSKIHYVLRITHLCKIGTYVLLPPSNFRLVTDNTELS